MDKLEKVIKGLECCGFGHCHPIDCPYYVEMNNCDGMLKRDAFALLKAQQPRVMTLDEVRAAEVVWLEQCEVCVCAIKIQNFDSGTMSFAYEYNNYTSFINIKPEYYGKVSRCWTGRPTLEQMQEAKWDV